MTFLKPTVLKIVLTFILFIAVDWLWRNTLGRFIMDVSYSGIPLHYFTAWGPCQAGENCSEFNGLNLVLDLIFWYIVSAFFISRFQKKKEISQAN
jgi:hypothetical protein